MKNHLENLHRRIPDGTDGILVISQVNRLYCTGFASSNGTLLLCRDDAVFYTDGRYIENAEKSIDCCKVELQEDLWRQVSDFCEKHAVKRLILETGRLSYAQATDISRRLSGTEVCLEQNADEILNELRTVKDSQEVEAVIRAQRIAEQAFENVLKKIRAGVTEREIALELDYEMLTLGAHGISFETIAVSGKNSSMPHGVPTDKKIENGDFITMDFGAVYDGYHSDMTRTVAVGSVSEKQRRVYDCVLRAQKAAIQALSAGVKECRAADAAARGVIEAEGFGKFFNHSTGHGVGLEIHEAPNLSPKSEASLCEGMIVTAEPGIYLPQEFGVRIEDMLLITADGCVNLTKTPKDLMILP